MRLNGWQRLGIVLALLWLPVGYVWGNMIVVHRADWALYLLQECEKLRTDWSSCNAEFEAHWKTAMEYRWQFVALFIALPFVALPVLWGLVRGFRSVFRWVAAGFGPPNAQ